MKLFQRLPAAYDCIGR